MNLSTKSHDFSAWMKAVDEIVWSKAFCSVYELDDCTFQDWFDQGKTPQQAAVKAIRYSLGQNGRTP
jgi:hypothetical protein